VSTETQVDLKDQLKDGAAQPAGQVPAAQTPIEQAPAGQVPAEQAQKIEMEVFRAGSYPQGDVSEADLDDIVATYDPALHEAPVTLDHATSGPALGWVASLSRVGDRLVARLRDVSGKLKELVGSGAYRKRSAEIYLDFAGTGRKYLRAVTFLGAGVPEVKGLAEVRFDERNGAWAEVPCDLKPGVAALIRRKLSGLLRLIDSQQEPKAASPKPAAEASFSEEAVREREERARAEVRAELAAAKAELEGRLRAHDVAVFVERLTAEGRLLPCWSEDVAAFTLYLEGAGRAEESASFAEGRLKTPAAWFREWLTNLPRLVEFGEAARENENEASVSSGERLQELALERMRLRPELTFGEAFREVCASNPSLAADYLEEVS
jgi:hypothetical protein